MKHPKLNVGKLRIEFKWDPQNKKYQFDFYWYDKWICKLNVSRFNKFLKDCREYKDFNERPL